MRAIIVQQRLQSALDILSLIGILIIVLNFADAIIARYDVYQFSDTLLCQDSETRCECGQLIAKVRGQGLELKCKRCKRIVVIPFTSIEGWGTVPA